jgi:hypothetical protein
MSKKLESVEITTFYFNEVSLVNCNYELPICVLDSITAGKTDV